MSPVFAMILVSIAGSVGGAEAPDAASLDRQIFDVLKEINNRGADLNNAGDPVGCYRLYQGGLLALKPLLVHRPSAQKIIEDGLRAADRRALPERAMGLHATIAEVRAVLKPPPTAARPAPTPAPVLPMPTPANTQMPASFPSPAAPLTLWDRLGGEKKVEKLVADWVSQCLADPQVNLTRDGKYKLDDEVTAAVKRRFIGYVSSVTEGTSIPTGRPLADAHAALPFQPSEYAALVGQLRKALQSNGVADSDAQALIKKVEDGKADVLGEAVPK